MLTEKTWQRMGTAPLDGTHILLRYYKASNRKYYITQAFCKHNVMWWDYADRLLCSVICANAKKQKNRATHWKPVPKEI